MRIRAGVLLALTCGSLAASQQPRPEPAGAPHWAFVRPERSAPRLVDEHGWGRNPIDGFILARLQEEGLQPSAEADRATWIRRLSLDLIGLPPSVEEVEAFEADDAPDSYERLVERLLASPHFGERVALQWLDLARFADTNGYLSDSRRQMWKWRDWLIEAFNSDKPYDELTVELLAGDLLPDATLAQRIATGFNRNHPVAGEGDGQPGEYAHRYVADRVKTTSAVWMGLTLACAECHNHKFDPISQREYYGFYAFFNNVPETGLMPGEGNPRPLLRVPTEEQGAVLFELQGRIDEQRRLRSELAAEAELGQARWESELRGSSPPATAEDALVAHVPLDEDRPEAALRGIGHSSWVDGVLGSALQLSGDDSFVDCGPLGAFSAGDSFSLSAWVRYEGEPTDSGGTILAKVDESRGERGYWFGLDEDLLVLDLIASDAPDDDLFVVTRDPLERHRWHHVAATYDGSREVSGLRLYVNGRRAPLEAADPDDPTHLEGDIDNTEALRIGCTDGSPFRGAIDEVRLHERALEPEEIDALVLADVARLARATEPLAPEARFLLRDYYQARVSPELAPILARGAELEAERRAAFDELPMVSVMSERAERRPTHLLRRGDYTRPRDVVEPGVPAVLPPLPEGAPLDRLTLARWLVHPDHPLTGRVAVNRAWARLFGTGLVATLDDFGTQGEAPSHPELLDWLAREFVDGGWDYKQLVRTIVGSATYRQRSHVSAELLERDPANRLLARAPRLPLDAELVRDNALSIAGILDPRLYGPSVKPWQPEGLWLAAAPSSDYAYEPSPVADRYRRGLYVYWKRGAPYASFTVFDAPEREVCTLQRTRTNTPLQALALLNDRVYVEAARGLAQRLLQVDGTDAERLARGFRLCVARAPEPRELAELGSLLLDQRGRFESHPERAAELASVGDLPPLDGVSDIELATWTAVGNVLLNLDETLTRG